MGKSKKAPKNAKKLEVKKFEDLDERELNRLYDTDVKSPRQCWDWPAEARPYKRELREREQMRDVRVAAATYERGRRSPSSRVRRKQRR